MSVTPTVSVVIPTYDRAPYLREAVASVRGQTREDWELIVVDDGSTDDTIRWLRSVQDPRLRVVEERHTGNVAKLRNVGARRATGRWIAFLDSDDRWAPGKLARQLDELERHPHCGWSYTRAGMIDADGGAVADEWIDQAPDASGAILRRLLLHEARIVVPAVMVDRGLLAKVDGFDESLPFCEDYDLWIRLAQASPVVAVPERLCEMRRHPGNTTRGQPEIEASLVQVYGRYAAALEDPALREICRAQEEVFRARWANRLSAAGRGVEAIRVLTSALPSGVATAVWWSTLARIVLRPMTPEAFRRRFRRPLPRRP